MVQSKQAGKKQKEDQVRTPEFFVILTCPSSQFDRFETQFRHILNLRHLSTLSSNR
jgi:uncharacterized protein (DUF2225 family)